MFFSVTPIVLYFIVSIAHANLHDRNHYKDGKHDENFDHESVVGSDKAPDYDAMTPEESQKRLIQLVTTKIDTNGDGYVSQRELRDHVDYMQRRNVIRAVDDAWKTFAERSPTYIKNDEVHWADYQAIIFGENFDMEKVDPTQLEDYKLAFTRNQDRFNAADADGNGALTRIEYGCFLRPEYCDYMRDEVVNETLHEMDKNKDGFIDFAEYSRDMTNKIEAQGIVNEPDSDWQQQEKKMFHSNWDRDFDGKLNRTELAAWVMPVGMDYAENEALHLISTADDNRDGQLSSDEFVKHLDTFVGSQTTDFGKQLKKHDPTEL